MAKDPSHGIVVHRHVLFVYVPEQSESPRLFCRLEHVLETIQADGIRRGITISITISST